MTDDVYTQIRELQIFINAAELIAGDDWSPNQSQWGKIKGKLMDLPTSPPAKPLSPLVEPQRAQQVAQQAVPVDAPGQSVAGFRDLTPQQAASLSSAMATPAPQRAPVPLPSSMATDPTKAGKPSVDSNGNLNTSAFI